MNDEPVLTETNERSEDIISSVISDSNAKIMNKCSGSPSASTVKDRVADVQYINDVQNNKVVDRETENATVHVKRSLVNNISGEIQIKDYFVNNTVTEENDDKTVKNENGTLADGNSRLENKSLTCDESSTTKGANVVSENSAIAENERLNSEIETAIFDENSAAKTKNVTPANGNLILDNRKVISNGDVTFESENDISNKNSAPKVEKNVAFDESSPTDGEKIISNETVEGDEIANVNENSTRENENIVSVGRKLILENKISTSDGNLDCENGKNISGGENLVSEKETVVFDDKYVTSDGNFAKENENITSADGNTVSKSENLIDANGNVTDKCEGEKDNFDIAKSEVISEEDEKALTVENVDVETTEANTDTTCQNGYTDDCVKIESVDDDADITEIEQHLPDDTEINEKNRNIANNGENAGNVNAVENANKNVSIGYTIVKEEDLTTKDTCNDLEKQKRTLEMDNNENVADISVRTDIAVEENHVVNGGIAGEAGDDSAESACVKSEHLEAGDNENVTNSAVIRTSVSADEKIIAEKDIKIRSDDGADSGVNNSSRIKHGAVDIIGKNDEEKCKNSALIVENAKKKLKTAASTTKETIETVETDEKVPDDKPVDLTFVNVNNSLQLYSCPICLKEFKYASSRYTHVAKTHKLPMHLGAIHCLEPGCIFSCSFTNVLQQHLSRVHDIPMTYSNFEFDTFEDFELWKQEYEKKESCRFVRKSGLRMKRGKVSGYLYCSRSGHFVSHSTGKKQLKKLGTSKISAHCTASMKYFHAPGDKVKVNLCSTHYGHQKDYRHLRLSKSDRKAILEQMKLGVPRDILLDTVRSSCGAADKLDRVHLLSPKDLSNIERANKLVIGSSVASRSKSKTKYTEEWVEEIGRTTGEENSVLFFKKKNCPDEFLNETDDCLILMTPGQSDVCRKLCDQTVMYATVLLLPNLGNFYLTTLLVVDEFRSTFPVAFMISNRRDEKAMQVFFERLKMKQNAIKLRAFVTDNLEYIFDAWCRVMGPVNDHVWANRYVDEEWRDYLSVIADEKLQMKVYDEIYQFIEHADDSYKKRLHDVIHNISATAECSVFGQYLSQYFLNNVRMWATCYLKDITGISEPINFDTTYNKIREAFEHSNIKYLSKSAQELIKLMVQFHMERNQKISATLQEIRKTHDMNSADDMQNVFPFQTGTWKIAAPGTSTDVSIPETITEELCIFGRNCTLRCDKCDICIHLMKCSCSYYVKKFVCKHIHLLASLLKLQRAPSSSNALSSADANNADEHRVRDNDESNDQRDGRTVAKRSPKRMKSLKFILRNKIITTLTCVRRIAVKLKRESSLFTVHDAAVKLLKDAKVVSQGDFAPFKGFTRRSIASSKDRLDLLQRVSNAVRDRVARLKRPAASRKPVAAGSAIDRKPLQQRSRKLHLKRKAPESSQNDVQPATKVIVNEAGSATKKRS